MRSGLSEWTTLIFFKWLLKLIHSGANVAAAAAKTAEVAVQNEVQYHTRSNRICPKKEIIFDKLDTLLKKLGAETFNRKQTDAAAQVNADATLKAWLDAESEYRIQEEKVKEAEEGSKFARERYKKYSEIVKQTQERLDTKKPTYNKELEDIAEEKALLQEIFRTFGILGDQPLTDTAKNAGGNMSGSATKAMPQQLHLRVKDQLALQAKLAELQKDAQNGGPISLQQIALLQTKLANFHGSDEVKQMLIDMLKDLVDRADALNYSLERTETELAGHKKKLYDYETSVVDLSNCHLLLSQGVLTLSYFVLTRWCTGLMYINSRRPLCVHPQGHKVIMAKINEFCVGK